MTCRRCPRRSSGNRAVRWQLTPEEFLLLWPQVGIARVPFPLQVRESVPLMNERAHLVRTTGDRLERGGVLHRGRIDADLENVLRTLGQPVMCCTAFGFYGPRPEQLVRVRAAHTGGIGVLAVQSAGITEEAGGEVVLSTVAASGLAEAMVGALPLAPPGTTPAASLSTVARSDGYSSVNVMHNAEQREAERFQRLLDGPFTGAGQIVVTAQDAVGEPRKLNTLRWFDLPGDGRYLALHGARATVRPAAAATLTAALHEQLGALVRR